VERARSAGASFGAARRCASAHHNHQIVDLPAVESFPLADARPRIAAIIENNVKRDDEDEPDPHRGYTAIAFTGEGGGSRTMGVDVTAGGIVGGNAFLRTGGYKVGDPHLSAV
jgi:hypothetical protein